MMSTFTMSLKRVIDLTGGTTEIVNNITKLTGGSIGLDAYEIYDASYRDILNGKIVDHYWNREICTESIDMFQMMMRRKMNEIMPIYNQLYKSTQIAFDPLSTIDMKTVATSGGTQNVTDSSTSNATNGSTNKSRSVASETPQTMLNGSGDYATSAADVNGTTDSTSNATQGGTSDSTQTGNADTEVTGYQGLASDLIMRYRESLINVDLMIINDLEELFMLVWDTGDTYTDGGYFL